MPRYAVPLHRPGRGRCLVLPLDCLRRIPGFARTVRVHGGAASSSDATVMNSRRVVIVAPVL